MHCLQVKAYEVAIAIEGENPRMGGGFKESFTFFLSYVYLGVYVWCLAYEPYTHVRKAEDCSTAGGAESINVFKVLL